MALLIFLSGCRYLPQCRFIKNTSSSLFLGVLLYLSTGQTNSIPNTFLLYLTGSYRHSLDQRIMYNTYGKENTDEEDVKRTYIWLRTFAVVTSAVNGYAIFPVVHVRCSLYPKIHPLV